MPSVTVLPAVLQPHRQPRPTAPGSAASKVTSTFDILVTGIALPPSGMSPLTPTRPPGNHLGGDRHPRIGNSAAPSPAPAPRQPG